jgi:DNA-binding response OmpR family regulator
MNTVIPRIRVIVSDSALLHSIPGLLVKAGFDVSVSTDPDDALPFVADAHPEVVLCDERIPGEDTLEVLRRIKTASPGSRIVLLSSRSDWASYEDVLRHQGDAICPRRPLRVLALLGAIDRALQDIRA